MPGRDAARLLGRADAHLALARHGFAAQALAGVVKRMEREILRGIQSGQVPPPGSVTTVAVASPDRLTADALMQKVRELMQDAPDPEKTLAGIMCAPGEEEKAEAFLADLLRAVYGHESPGPLAPRYFVRASDFCPRGRFVAMSVAGTPIMLGDDGE